MDNKEKKEVEEDVEGVSTSLEADITIRRTYNPLSKIECLEAAAHLIVSPEDSIEYVPQLPDKDFVGDSLTTEENRKRVIDIKETFFADKNIRFFDFITNMASPYPILMDEALDIVTLDPNIPEGREFWNNLFSEPRVLEGMPAGVEAFKYDLVDNLLFMGQIVMAVKTLYNIQDVRPTYESKVAEFFRALTESGTIVEDFNAQQ